MEPVQIPFFAWSIFTIVASSTAIFVGTAVWRYADHTKQRIDELDTHVRKIDKRVVALEARNEHGKWASEAL